MHAWTYSHTYTQVYHMMLFTQRVCCTWQSAMPGQHSRVLEQAQSSISPRKIVVTCKSPVGDISAVTLIRTDTTLDHSQKAEKLWFCKLQLLFLAQLASLQVVFGNYFFCRRTCALQSLGMLKDLPPNHTCLLSKVAIPNHKIIAALASNIVGPRPP